MDTKNKKSNTSSVVTLIVVFVLGLVAPSSTLAVIPPDLTFGITATYSVYGHAGITNANAGTRVWGNVGDNNVVHSGFTATQVPSGIIDTSTANGTAIESDASSVYDSLMSATQGTPTSLNLAGTHTVANGNPITPGVYTVGATTLNGAVELSGAGVYIFRSSSTNTTPHSGTMTLTNGATPCNVWWAIAGAMTIGTDAHIEGTIIAQTGLISFAGSSLVGRAISLVGQVTLDGGANQITQPTCAPASATLHIIKDVVNDSGGALLASNSIINVTGTNVSSSSFAGSAAGVNVTLDAGSYSVTEPVVPSGYLESGSGNCSGTIIAGETKICTITNDDIAPQLIVNKTVVNNSGGAKVISDFSLLIDSSSVLSGVASTTTVGLHTVSEAPDSAYAPTIGGDCAADGRITLALGDVKTCTITNDDIASTGGGGSYISPIPPLIDVVKIPSPLALPNGPGPVTYTYTLRNIGTVPVSNVTMVGDTCSPITLVSGDTNTDARLDVSETWTYTCSTTLLKTHTNIVTANGWANGVSATDVANATVVVGLPVVPPLIHVVKKPNVSVLPAGGGAVTYTYTVTNPGTAPLSNVSITDDKCSGLPSRVVGHPGDLNHNDLLESNETWSFTCRTNLSQTTTNTGTAEGSANGLTAKDFAITTVVVSTIPFSPPSFPKMGLLPDDKSNALNMIILAGVTMIISISLIVVLRKRTT